MTSREEKTDCNNGSGACLFDLLRSEHATSWNWQREDSTTASPLSRLEGLLDQPGNRVCADCASPDPKWVSLSHGVFICIKCSGVHRSLGVHISKVLSVKLDDWTNEQVDCLGDKGGNAAVNKKYEAHLLDFKKPKPESTIEERSDFIRRKYEKQQFLNSDMMAVTPLGSKQLCSSSSRHCPTSNASFDLLFDKKLLEKHTTRIHGLGHAFRHSWKKKESDHKTAKKTNSSNNISPGMVEFIGLIKINIVRGTNLAVRDMMTSDPYVILTLGNQSMKTRVIKSNLNPVWNESLMLSIPDPTPSLRVQVYDKDTFTTDDFMGDAEIDIQPLIAAAKQHENSTTTESMQLGKCVANKDNTLVTDSVMNLIDGKVKQEIKLKLQNVERGVLQMELECVPLSQ